MLRWHSAGKPAVAPAAAPALIIFLLCFQLFFLSLSPQHNAGSHTFSMSVNEFADMTFEFAELLASAQSKKGQKC